jgi:hypothetical protein
MNLRIQLAKDIAADKITETDQVIMSLSTVKIQFMTVGQTKIFFVDVGRNGMRENVTIKGQIITDVTPKHLYQR